MFIAVTYVWKRFVHIFHRWLKELGSLNGSNGGNGAKSIFAITDTVKEKCEILVANIILKDYFDVGSTRLRHFYYIAESRELQQLLISYNITDSFIVSCKWSTF